MQIKSLIIAVASIATCIGYTKTAEELINEVNNSPDAGKWYESVSDHDWETLADYRDGTISTTNCIRHYLLFENRLYGHFFPNGINNPVGDEVSKKYDIKFSSKGIGVFPFYTKRAPLSTMVWLNNTTNEWVNAHPCGVVFYKQLISGTNIEDGVAFKANMLIESLAWPLAMNHNCGHDFLFPKDIAVAKKRILEVCPRIVRIGMRKNGMSFVAKDGKNPVQDEIDILSEALNSPKMAGVKEWFAKWCPEYQWRDAMWPSDNEIAKLKEDIMLGDVKFRDKLQILLSGYIGVDAFNTFVKKYNGD